jgi:hypothetical protein
MNQEEKQQLRDRRVNLSFVRANTIRIRWRGRKFDRRSQSKRTKSVKTAFAEKQREATATDIPHIYWRWRELVRRTKKVAQKKYPLLICSKLKGNLRIYIILHIYISVRCFYLKRDRHSDSVWAGWTGEFRWERDFPHLTDLPWAPPSNLFNGCHVTPGGKAAGVWH